MTRAGKRSRATGIMLVGAGLLLTQVLRSLSYNRVEIDRYDGLWMVNLIPLIAIASGALLFWRGRQHASRAVASAILTDAKPDVLYLRTFRDDSSTARYVFSTLVSGGVAAATEEEQLAEVLRPFGDLVAIGEPGEALPVPGAARMYASDKEWKGVILHQMLAARLVVIRAGLGDNLLWEVQQAVANVSSNKVLILFMNIKATNYEVFRYKARPFLWVPLPETSTVQRGLRSTVAGFIGFTPDWEPRFYPLKAPHLRRNAFKPQQHLFQYALRPVFEAAGLAWQPPPVMWFMKAALVVAVVIGLFMLVIVGSLVTRC